MLGIHSLDVKLRESKLQHQKIPVLHILEEKIRIVRLEMEFVYVLVDQDISDSHHIAELNVLLIKIVHQIVHVEIRNVSIHVQDFADEMRNAEQLIIDLIVSVYLAILEMRFLNVSCHHPRLQGNNLAIQTHVVLMLAVRKETALARVPAFQNILEIPTSLASRNVLRTMTVHRIRLASTLSVKTLVMLDYVEHMLSVKRTIMLLIVSVNLDTLDLLIQDVPE